MYIAASDVQCNCSLELKILIYSFTWTALLVLIAALVQSKIKLTCSKRWLFTCFVGRFSLEKRYDLINFHTRVFCSSVLFEWSLHHSEQHIEFWEHKLEALIRLGVAADFFVFLFLTGEGNKSETESRIYAQGMSTIQSKRKTSTNLPHVFLYKTYPMVFSTLLLFNNSETESRIYAHALSNLIKKFHELCWP